MRNSTWAVLGALVVGLVFSAGALRPDLGSNRRLRYEAGALRASVDQRSARLEAASALRQSSAELAEDLAAFAQAIPRNQQIGAFLEDLDLIAREVGLSGKSVRPAEAIRTAELQCLPLDISVTGRFAALHEFVRRVEALPRVARVQRLELASREIPSEELVASVTLYVFFRPT